MSGTPWHEQPVSDAVAEEKCEAIPEEESEAIKEMAEKQNITKAQARQSIIARNNQALMDYLSRASNFRFVPWDDCSNCKTESVPPPSPPEPDEPEEEDK